MAKNAPGDPNFTMIGAVAAAVIIAGYVVLLHTSGYLEKGRDLKPLRSQPEEAQTSQ